MKKKYFLILIYLIANQQFIFSQNVGINTPVPKEALHVTGNVQVSGALKVANGLGTSGQLLQTNGNSMTWVNAPTSTTNNNGNLGYGSWGDCATNANITEYCPTRDTDASNFSYGLSLALSGDFAIVGSFGKATILKLVAGEWVFYQDITAPGVVNTDLFGRTVAIENDYVMVGAPGDTETLNQQGSVSVFKLIAGVWTYQQKLIDSQPGVGDQFGSSLAISGEFCIIGAFIDDDPSGGVDQGSASIFNLNAGNWVHFQKITDASAGLDPGRFGESVDIENDYAIVGAPNATNTINRQGIAVIFKFNGTAWVQQQRIFKNSAAEILENFGVSVAISAGMAVIGAPFTDNNSLIDTGSASIFHLVGSSWVFNKIVFNTNDVQGADDNFGASVDINSSYIFIGSPSDDILSKTDQGSATLYKRVGNRWQLYQFVKDPAGEIFDSPSRFINVALDASTFRFGIGLSNTGKAIFGKIN